MSWETAFLLQAQSDWQIYKKLNTPNIEDCHRLHYLLMASEKLAKHYLSTVDNPPEKSHYVLDTFIHSCNFNTDLRNYLGFKDNKKGYVEYLKSIKQTAFEFLKLVPRDLSSMNVEYPWMNTTRAVMIPCRVNFLSVLNITTAKMGAFVNFIERLTQFVKR